MAELVAITDEVLQNPLWEEPISRVIKPPALIWDDMLYPPKDLMVKLPIREPAYISPVEPVYTPPVVEVPIPVEAPGAAQSIAIDKSLVETKAVNLDEIAQGLLELAEKMKAIPFAEQGECQSRGLCVNQLAELTLSGGEVLTEMAATVTDLLKVIRSGSDNLVETDKYLASLMGTVTIGGVAGGDS